MKTKIYLLFFISTILVAGSIAYDMYKNTHRGWMVYQREYYRLLAEKTNKPALANSPLQIVQTWNVILNKADRCQTCHMGINIPIFKDAPQPFTTHPDLQGFMHKHPFGKFGCTVCHDGNGLATTVASAHGFNVTLDYQPKFGPFAEASCTKCHTDLYNAGVNPPMTPYLNLAKKTITQKGCGSCHSMVQFNLHGVLAPDLSGFGSRTELGFYNVHLFEYVNGIHSEREWEWEHFKNPRRISPGVPAFKVPPTIMPNFHLTDEQTTALTTWVLGLIDPAVITVPQSYLPIERSQGRPTPIPITKGNMGVLPDSAFKKVAFKQ
ncbi:MAG: c-type cytochrome [Leptospirillum sp.]